MFDARRKALLSIGACMCTTAVALMPLAGRSSFDTGKAYAASPNAVTASVRPQSTPAPPVVVARDPFAADTQDVAVAQERTGAAGPHSHVFAIVRAIISGAQPRALVEEDGSARIVAIGDRISGARISAIAARSLRLDNGVTLDLEGNAP